MIGIFRVITLKPREGFEPPTFWSPVIIFRQKTKYKPNALPD